MTPAVKFERQIDRFWKRVDRSQGPLLCWIWTGARTADGYGRVWFEERDSQAHRVSYRLKHGPIEPGTVVRHKCDNRPCVNPLHLIGGTIADNVQDMVERNRQARGERTGGARLRSDQVFAIRVLFAAGEATRYQLAERFGVSHRQICHIIHNKRWKAE